MFIPSHPKLNERIVNLHSRLPYDEHAQVKIDAHLLCAAAAMRKNPLLGKMDVSKLMLVPEDSPQLSTLPDLGPAIRSCLVSRQWSSNFLAHLLYCSLPCPHPTAKIPPPDQASTSIALNLVMATLLGLYPSCVKRPPFPVRAALYARVHSVLTSTGETQCAFALKYQPLLTLAVAEYICYVLPAFFPSEHASLCSSHSVDPFFTAGPALFDLFRQVTITTASVTTHTRFL